MRQTSVFAKALGHCLTVAFALAGLGLLAFIGSAHAQTQFLYGATAAGAQGELYRLNPATGGMLQDIGPLNDATGANYGITGLAFRPVTGVLYGSSANANPATRARLVTINPSTGAVTLIGPFNAGPVNTSGVPATMSDIAFDSAGNLFGIGSIGGPQLYSINTSTGQATVIGNSGLTDTAGGGLAISSAGVFYGTPTVSRYGIYNPVTGAYTNIANPVKPLGSGSYAALAFNGSGSLYGLNLGSGSPPPTAIVIVDPPTGAVTLVGLSVNELDAIAFGPAPCPADINHSGSVNIDDLLSVISAWGACPPAPCPADVNLDTVVNVNDLLAVISAWGSCP